MASTVMPPRIGNSALTVAILLVANICLSVAESNNDGHISSVRVVGSVFCDTCFRQEFSKSSYFIKGAPVAVECETGKEGPNTRIEANTNKHGQFEVELPSSIFHSETHLKKCSAALLQKEGPCRMASIANSSSFSLKSKHGGIHTYSAGFFTYRPQTIPSSCSNEVVNLNKIEVSRRSDFESSKQIGLPPFLSPFLPSPSPPPPSPPPPSLLPPFPSIPPFGFPPIPFLTPSPPPPFSFLPPIPFLTPSPPPPLSFLPPIPFLQPPPPSLIPPIGNLPNPFQPPSGFPFPPNPFQPPAPLLPIPPIPLIPPAQNTLQAHSTQP